MEDGGVDTTVLAIATQPDLTFFFSYSLTCEVNLIEFLEIMAQMGPYNIFLSLKPKVMNSDYILNCLKKVIGGTTTQKY